MRNHTDPNKLCYRCNQAVVAKIGTYPDGEAKHSKYCPRCRNATYNPNEHYRLTKNAVCASCGFVGHSCQLDVDHIDENHNNNHKSNLQTLCSNCHRLKTYKHRQANKILTES